MLNIFLMIILIPSAAHQMCADPLPIGGKCHCSQTLLCSFATNLSLPSSPWVKSLMQIAWDLQSRIGFANVR